MLWVLLGLDPTTSTILDVVFLLLTFILLAYIFKFKRTYGDWVRLANCDHIIVAIGRDNNARLICAERRHGIYLSLGDYGDVPFDGEAVYKVINVPQKNSISFIYLPYALLLRAKEMAAIRKFQRGEYRVVGRVIRVFDKNGQVIRSFECRDDEECAKNVEEYLKELSSRTGQSVDKLAKELRIEEEPIVETTIEPDEKIVIRPQDIRNWQIYSFNPIILRSMNESYLTSELGQYKGILTSVWIKILPIIAIVAFIGFVLAIIK